MNRKFNTVFAVIALAGMILTGCNKEDDKDKVKYTREIELYINVNTSTTKSVVNGDYSNFDEFINLAKQLMRTASKDVNKTYQIDTYLEPDDTESAACEAFYNMVTKDKKDDIDAAVAAVDNIATQLKAKAQELSSKLTEAERINRCVVTPSVVMSYNINTSPFDRPIVMNYDKPEWKVVLNERN